MNVKTRQVCLAHLLRNGIFLNELDEEQMWSRQFIQCLTDAIKMRKDGSVTESKIMELRTKMDKLLNENLLTSSLRTPKIIIEESGDTLMPCH